jgi:predicted RNA binding protein YcfA (HicA-like mRNA interferase family)
MDNSLANIIAEKVIECLQQETFVQIHFEGADRRYRHFDVSVYVPIATCDVPLLKDWWLYDPQNPSFGRYFIIEGGEFVSKSTLKSSQISMLSSDDAETVPRVMVLSETPIGRVIARGVELLDDSNRRHRTPAGKYVAAEIYLSCNISDVHD